MRQKDYEWNWKNRVCARKLKEKKRRAKNKVAKRSRRENRT